MRKCYIILLFFIFLANGVQAQNYASQKLSEIGSLFPKTCLPPKDSIFDCSPVLKNKSFIIQYNTKNEIEHLGISLFSRQAKQMINEPVCNFIERLALELLLLKTDDNIKKKLQEEQIRIEEENKFLEKKQTFSIRNLLNNLKTPVYFALNQQDNNYYACWTQETGERYIITFPASRELIFGTNKKESDITLGEQLFENRCEHPLKNNHIVKKSELEVLSGNNTVFLRKGGEYIFPELNADTYYSQDAKGNFNPVTDVKNPAFFLKNLLLISQLKTTLKIKIKHRMYGSFTPEFEIKPSNFICFFQPEFDMYCHVDDSKENLLKATVILHNSSFSYIHLLSIITSVKTLYKENGILEAEFFSNIPQHNIKNILEN